MSYNGSGTFQINTSGQPVVTGTSISSTVFNALTADLATGLSTAITKDGQTTTTARIPFALGINSTLVTDATNTTSGSIITAGGVGIAKAVFIGTTLNVAGASTMTGSIAVDSVTDSSSTTTGSIQTDGGVGIAKALYVGTTANVAGVATLTSNPVLSAGTANGVAYLNGSKVLTTGSALVFDGTNLGVGVTPSAWRNLFNVLQSGASSSFVGQTNSNTTYVASNWYTTSGGTDTRIAAGYASQYYQDSGQHVWRTAATSTAGSAISFTQAMTLDASGNLAVGISSGYRTAASYNAFALNGTTGSLIDLYANSTRVGGIAATSGQVTVSSITSIPLVFSTADTERARIDSSGRLIVGGSNINGRIQSITPASYTESSFRADSATAASTNWNHFYGTSSSNSVANIIIYGNGNIVNANNSYGSLSDVKIKENIVDATPKLADLMQVKVRSYNLKSDPLHKQLGVIAQELETVFPGLVDESPDYEQQIKTREVEVPAVAEVRDNEGNIITQAVEATTQTEKYTEQVALGTVTKSVKYSVFVPMLIKALQEQQALITTLTDRITALEARNV